MKCLYCGKGCFEDKYPEVVFKDGDLCVCEKCSIEFEQKGKSFGYRTEKMNIHQSRVYHLIHNMWYNELETCEGMNETDSISNFETWCEDNLDSEEQKAIMEKVKHHVDAISEILTCFER